MRARGAIHTQVGLRVVETIANRRDILDDAVVTADGLAVSTEQRVFAQQRFATPTAHYALRLSGTAPRKVYHVYTKHVLYLILRQWLYKASTDVSTDRDTRENETIARLYR